MKGCSYRKDIFIDIELGMMLRVEDPLFLVFDSQKHKGAWNLRNPPLFRKHTPDIGIGDVVDWID